MKKNAVFFIFILIITFSSCNKDNDFETIQNSGENNVEGNFKVSPEEALNTLKYFIANEESTRSIKDISIQSIEAFVENNTDVTRNNVNNKAVLDTLMYIINFSNGNGFALMASDKRTEPIYALVDEGNFNQKDMDEISKENPPFNMFLEMTKEYIKYCTKSRTRIGDETEIGQGDGSWVLDRYTPAKVSFKWNQSYPYNQYTPLKNGQHTLTGCVATALGMATAYFHSTFTINGYTLDLSGSDMNTTSQLVGNSEKANIVARLLSEIGVNIVTNYGINASSASIANAESYLRTQADIKFVTGFRKYETGLSAENLFTCLRSRKGVAVFYGAKADNSSAHMWIVDGIKNYKTTEHDFTKKLNLYHCNWGWGGSKDGYYLETIYSIGTTSFDFISGGITSNSPVSYSRNLQYCALGAKRID